MKFTNYKIFVIAFVGFNNKRYMKYKLIKSIYTILKSIGGTQSVILVF